MIVPHLGALIWVTSHCDTLVLYICFVNLVFFFDNFMPVCNKYENTRNALGMCAPSHICRGRTNLLCIALCLLEYVC